MFGLTRYYSKDYDFHFFITLGKTDYIDWTNNDFMIFCKIFNFREKWFYSYLFIV